MNEKIEQIVTSRVERQVASVHNVLCDPDVKAYIRKTAEQMRQLKKKAKEAILLHGH